MDDAAAMLYRLKTDEVHFLQTFLRIVDENNVLVPFRLANRPMQMDFKRRILDTKARYVAELKARRVGGTSLFMALGLVRCHLRRNYGVLLIAQSDSDSQAFMREGFQRYYNNMVTEAELPNGTMFYPRATVDNFSDHSITFPEIGSRIVVATAGSIKLGRGQGFDMVIGTEVARWDVGRPPGTAEECWAMATGAMADKPDTLAIQESTAYGAAGHFYMTYQAAKRGENGYVPLFYSWKWHPAYRLEAGDTRTREVDRGDIELDETEILLGLTKEQARWRRATIAGMPGGLPMFLQEYPEDDETCFRMSGDPYFDANLVDRRIQEARPILTSSESGRLRIWQTPRIGEKYILSVDPGGEGVDRRFASQERDYDAVGVYDSRLNHVATLHGRLDTRTLAQMITDLGTYYNTALIIV